MKTWKTITLKTILLSMIISAGSIKATAQKSIQDIAEMKDKQWDKFVKTDATGLYWLEGLTSVGLLDADKAPQPKKIGLLTMQLYAASTSSTSSAGDWSYTTTFSTSASGQQFLIDYLKGYMYPAIKTSLGNVGIELLEPNEFANTAEKQKIYEEGKDRIEASGFTKMITSNWENGKETDFAGMVPTGYEWYPITASVLNMDIKGPANYGMLAEELGLDGVMIITIGTTSSKKYITLNRVEMAIAGPVYDNKEVEYKGRIGAGNMNTARGGVMYGYAGIEKLEIPIIQIKKNDFAGHYLDGFDVISAKLGSTLAARLEELKSWQPKKAKKK